MRSIEAWELHATCYTSACATGAADGARFDRTEEHLILEVDDFLHTVVGDLSFGTHQALTLLSAVVEEAAVHLMPTRFLLLLFPPRKPTLQHHSIRGDALKAVS